MARSEGSEYPNTDEDEAEDGEPSPPTHTPLLFCLTSPFYTTAAAADDDPCRVGVWAEPSRTRADPEPKIRPSARPHG